MGEIAEKVAEAKKKAKKRKFLQRVDLAVNLKNINLAKPENRFNKELVLPHSKGKEPKVCVIAQTSAPQAKELGVTVIDRASLEKYKDKKAAKELARTHDHFLAEAPLMVEVGKILGPVLGPRGKMPKPFPPGADLKPLIEQTKRILQIKLTQNPVIHVPVGNEEMPDEEIEENIKAVLDLLERNLPKGSQQIGSAYVKLTMGPSVRIR